MNQPLISVIVVVYNACDTIDACIKSVLSQDYKNVELVVIDGGSKDDTLNIIKKYEPQLGYFISEPDKGIYDAMNKAITAATGEWLYFLGADDVFFNESVLTAVFLNSHVTEARFVYGDVVLKSNGKILGGSRTVVQLIEKNISHQAIFYHKSIFNQVGNYQLSYKVLADYDFNLRVYKDASIVKQYLPINICLFNDKGGTSNVTIDSAFFLDKLNFFKDNKELSLKYASLQQYFFYSGFVLLVRDKKWKGFVYLLQSFIAGPRKIFYILVFGKFLLGMMGVGNKIKIV